MYPIKLGFSEAVKRVKKLMDNGHDAEALLTSVFTVEKTFYRTFRLLIVSAGFPSVQADNLLRNIRGFENIKGSWQCFDPKHEPLSVFIPTQTLATIKKAQEMRNKLVHGSRVYGMKECRSTAKEVLKELEVVRKAFKNRYDFDGWSVTKIRRKSRLHEDPRVKI